MKASDLAVVGAYYDPNRYKTPVKLLTEWATRYLDYGVKLVLVEHQSGERPFVFTADNLPHVELLQLRGGPQHRVWLQYPLYRAGCRLLSGRTKYINFADTDIRHVREDWWYETLHMLQDHPAGQTWKNAIDLDPDGNVALNDHGNEVDRSFCAAWHAGEVDIKAGPYAPRQSRALLPKKDRRDWRSHTGYSSAFRMDVLERAPDLLPDWFITGSSDYHMWHGFVGNLRQMAADNRANPGSPYSEGYNRKLDYLHDLAEKHIKQDIGFVPGTLLHGWHGSKALRLYGAREDINREAAYDPYMDIAHDIHGLPYLCSDNRALRDGIRRYDSRRNADCIRVDTPN